MHSGEVDDVVVGDQDPKTDQTDGDGFRLV